MHPLIRSLGQWIMTGIDPLDAVFRTVARWLASSAVSALADAGLARIGVSEQTKGVLFVMALLILIVAVRGGTLMHRARHGNPPLIQITHRK